MYRILLTIGLMITAAAPALAQSNVSSTAAAKQPVQKQTKAQLESQRQDLHAHDIASNQKADQRNADIKSAKIKEGQAHDQRYAADQAAKLAKTHNEAAKHDADVRAAKLADDKTDQRKKAELSDQMAKAHAGKVQKDAAARADAAKHHTTGEHPTGAPAASNAMTPKG